MGIRYMIWDMQTRTLYLAVPENGDGQTKKMISIGKMMGIYTVDSLVPYFKTNPHTVRKGPPSYCISWFITPSNYRCFPL